MATGAAWRSGRAAEESKTEAAPQVLSAPAWAETEGLQPPKKIEEPALIWPKKKTSEKVNSGGSKLKASKVILGETGVDHRTKQQPRRIVYPRDTRTARDKKERATSN